MSPNSLFVSGLVSLVLGLPSVVWAKSPIPKNIAERLINDSTCMEKFRAMGVTPTFSILDVVNASKKIIGHVVGAIHDKVGSGYLTKNRDGSLGFGQNGGDGLRRVDVSEVALELPWNLKVIGGEGPFLGFARDMPLKIKNELYRTQGMYEDGSILAYPYDADNEPRRIKYWDAVAGVLALATPNLKPRDLVNIHEYDDRTYGAKILSYQGLFAEVMYMRYAERRDSTHFELIPISQIRPATHADYVKVGRGLEEP